MKSVVALAWWAVACAGASWSEEDALVGALGGARGLNRLALCGGAGSPHCAAALWRPRWAVARAHCAAAPRGPVLRAAALADCDTLQPGAPPAAARSVRARRVHPHWQARWPGFDLALLMLDRPFDYVDRPANASAAKEHLAKFEYWMESVYAEGRHAASPRPALLATPLLTLLSTVVLPAGALLAAFLVLTFGSGAPLKVPYANVGDELALRTPWQAHGVTDIKCYPCGKV